MIWFAAICLFLVTVVLTSLVLSIRNSAGDSTNLALQTDTTAWQENIVITRERLKQIPDGPEFDQARRELESALADDLSTLAENTAGRLPVRHGRRSAYFALLVVPVAALAIYLSLGNTSWLDQDGLPTMAEIRDHPEASLDKLVQRLEQTLEEDPDNLDGWILAGRTYISMGRLEEGESAWARANELQPGNADLLSAWADASLLVNGNRFTPEIEARINRSLALNPSHANALWIAGMGNYSNGKLEQALFHLTRLQPLLAAQPEVQQQVGQIIDQLNQNLATGLQQEDTNPSAAPSGNRQIRASVSVAPGMQEQVDANQSVFVFALAIDGPAFPLAVARLQVSDLPATVVLDESNAMIGGQSIAGYDKVIVAARVSRSGEPVASPGDFTSAKQEVPTDENTRVNLEIDRLVE